VCRLIGSTLDAASLSRGLESLVSRSHEGAGKLALDLRRQAIDINAGLGQKRRASSIL